MKRFKAEAIQLWRIQGGIVKKSKTSGRRIVAAAALIGASTLVLAACSGSTDDASTPAGAGGGTDSTEFTYFGQTQNTTIVNTVTSLSTGICADAQADAPLAAEATD